MVIAVGAISRMIPLIVHFDSRCIYRRIFALRFERNSVCLTCLLLFSVVEVLCITTQIASYPRVSHLTWSTFICGVRSLLLSL